MLRGRRIDRAFLRRVGRPATWEKGLLCPNISDDGRHPYSCPYCSGGRGYQYVDPQTIKALFTSDDREEKFDLVGAWEHGKCEATVAANYAIADQDRLVSQDDPVAYSLVVERGSGDVDVLRVPHAVELVYVQGLTQGYTVGADCKLSQNENGDYHIEWLEAQAPTATDKYTVRLLIYPTWIVIGTPMIRSFGPGKRNQLMLRVPLQRFDRVVSREG
ncbi:MAG: hypothetical protein U9Q07_03355 [Planctomycetota bacterium]|nr:hypothetical protein [Planctomycetota bacterium]